MAAGYRGSWVWKSAGADHTGGATGSGWRRSLPPASSQDLLPFLESVAARIASLHPAKLLERRPVTLEHVYSF
jgi:hypothetical protein